MLMFHFVYVSIRKTKDAINTQLHTVCGFICPVIRCRRSSSLMEKVQSAFLSKKEKKYRVKKEEQLVHYSELQ